MFRIKLLCLTNSAINIQSQICLQMLCITSSMCFLRGLPGREGGFNMPHTGLGGCQRHCLWKNPMKKWPSTNYCNLKPSSCIFLIMICATFFLKLFNHKIIIESQRKNNYFIKRRFFYLDTRYQVTNTFPFISFSKYSWVYGSHTKGRSVI